VNTIPNVTVAGLESVRDAKKIKCGKRMKNE
jgi:hypothetical protein